MTLPCRVQWVKISFKKQSLFINSASLRLKAEYLGAHLNFLGSKN